VTEEGEVLVWIALDGTNLSDDDEDWRRALTTDGFEPPQA